MFAFVGVPFETAANRLRQMLVETASDVDVGEWHAQDVRGLSAMVSREVLNVSLELEIGNDLGQWQRQIRPNLPWAEDHFDERVCGRPLNPGEEYRNWPWARDYFDQYYIENGKFSHTYMERFWPKWAENSGFSSTVPPPHWGIRFAYGDLGDVVIQLIQNPLTRQAYLPVFFPEDTGAVHEERIPCTLGYHFIVRNNKLNCIYYLRSCDFVRYFRDDVYMAGRLAQWVWSKIRTTHPTIDVGKLLVHITSLHVMNGDLPKLEKEARRHAKTGP
jgi:thymidylate synthase-like protein